MDSNLLTLWYKIKTGKNSFLRWTHYGGNLHRHAQESWGTQYHQNKPRRRLLWQNRSQSAKWHCWRGCQQTWHPPTGSAAFTRLLTSWSLFRAWLKEGYFSSITWFLHWGLKNKRKINQTHKIPLKLFSLQISKFSTGRWSDQPKFYWKSYYSKTSITTLLSRKEKFSDSYSLKA